MVCEWGRVGYSRVEYAGDPGFSFPYDDTYGDTFDDTYDDTKSRITHCVKKRLVRRDGLVMAHDSRDRERVVILRRTIFGPFALRHVVAAA